MTDSADGCSGRLSDSAGGDGAMLTESSDASTQPACHVLGLSTSCPGPVSVSSAYFASWGSVVLGHQS